ncbi:MAG: choice-of-anchor B family protein [Ignavibacteriales bacterium]|nr:choice-of-anchor B family protein [Ignavibacteriales bacterium]
MSIRSASVAMLFLFSTLEAISQTSMNMQLVGQMRNYGTNGYSNCWGYVAPNGKEYALLGTFPGTQIVDISSDTLKEVAFIPGPGSGWREMKVYQKYAYVVTEGNGAGLQIIDLDSMKLVNTITTSQVPSGHTVSIEGKYLYINGARHGNGGIVVLDLTDPINPVVVGEYQTQYVHDCIVKNDTIYAAAIYGEGLDIIDATNKANIKRVNLVQYPFAGTHNTDVSADGKYVFTTDEINGDPNQLGDIVRVWDKADIMNVKLVGSYVAKPKTVAHNIHVKGKFGFVAHYTEGLRVIDINNPEIPVEVAFYDTYNGSGHSYAGNWGTFPYFQSNKVIASDMSGGLFVFKFPGQNTGIPVSRAVISVVDSATNQPIEGVTVEFVSAQKNILTDAQGKIKFGGLTDTVTLKFSKVNFDLGYESKIQKLTMPFDSTTAVTIKLKALPTGGLNITVKNFLGSAPIGGVKVQVQNTPVSGFTNTSGVIQVPQLLAGTSYRVLVSKFGFGVDSVDVIPETDQIKNIDIVLSAHGKDNFEFDLGWTVGSVPDSGTNGRWERVQPKQIVFLGDTLQPGQDHTDGGDLCFVTGSTNSLGDNVDGQTTLVSPSFNVSTMSNPVILYWLFINTRSNPMDDTLYVDISNDDGVTWKNAEIVTGKQQRWAQHRISTNPFVTGTDKMKMRFVARDGGAATAFEVAVDDVEFGDNLQLSVEPIHGSVPSHFSLSQNYPNPFNPTTTINYSIPHNGMVSLKIFDLLGKEAATLVESQQEVGSYSVTFDGSDLSSGIYFYTLRSGAFSETKKLVLTK